MGIALDNRIYASPRIQSPLGNPFQITNVGFLDNAKNLAITLTYGALPAPLQVASVQEVSATLGPDNVRASILAGAVGLVIVMLFRFSSNIMGTLSSPRDGPSGHGRRDDSPDRRPPPRAQG